MAMKTAKQSHNFFEVPYTSTRNTINVMHLNVLVPNPCNVMTIVKMWKYSNKDCIHDQWSVSK